MKRSTLLPLVALLAAAAPAMAQTPKVSGLVQVWYTQMLNDNLRLDGAAKTNGNAYYDGAKNFTENTFLLRRAEIHVSGDIANVKGLSYEINIDPSINTSATNPTILQDAYINWAGESGFEIRAGQMKTYQTY
ncbi:MAG TPA: porin, partial [Holophagaceae bacterium]|nr:porin [Holophagaceae bacterium]